MTRYKPTRAGIINLWDYIDEEFSFADGRLALRGHNGSGKTKALEVLFPFVLDGSLNPRRLDPFSGKNRTMKSNLLYRGQDAEYGYAWMEFARDADPVDVVTLIIGLRVHKDQDQPTPSYYVTGKRIGVDFGLLSADSRPLTSKQLTAKLGPADSFKAGREAYRAAVDARLFHLGPERYTQLLDLLLALRRPQLAKDLDPAKVSDTLTAGLSPVDEDLVEQAARDFDNLAAVEQRHRDLNEAKDAVGAFLAQYSAYVRAHTKFRLDRIADRIGECAGYAAAVHAARTEADRSKRAEETAKQAREDEGIRRGVLEARRDVLQDGEAYKDHAKLVEKRAGVTRQAEGLAKDQKQLARDRILIDDLTREAADVHERAQLKLNACARHEQDLMAGTGRAGLDRGPIILDPAAEDLLEKVKAAAAIRADDIRVVRGHLRQVADAEADRGRADQALGKARERAEACRQNTQAAVTHLAAARSALTESLLEWTGRWSGTNVEHEGLFTTMHEAADEIGEPGRPDLVPVFTQATAYRRDEAIALRTDIRRALEDLGVETELITRERDLIASKQDDAPPANDFRTAPRAERTGAPLWQLVRFHDHVSDDEAAAIEGALYGAGILTAWLHPAPEATREALERREADGYLLPVPASERPAGRTLADYLLPEDQDRVSHAVIADVLSSIAAAESVPDSATMAGRGAATAWITTAAQFGTGIQVGARPKPAPEYIGATNRAQRRANRMAELDLKLVDLTRRHTEEQKRSQANEQHIADFGRAADELPETKPVLTAVSKLSTETALAAAAENGLHEAGTLLDQAIAHLSEQQRNLRQAAGQRAMPLTAAEVDEIAQAVEDVRQAAENLVRDRADEQILTTDLNGRRGRIDDLEGQYLEAAEALAGLLAQVETARAALEEAEQSVGKEYQQIAAEIEGIGRKLIEVRGRWTKADQLASAEHDKRIGARHDLDNQTSTLIGSLTALREECDVFTPYAHPDLRAILGVEDSEPWPSTSHWPADTDAATQITTLLHDGDEQPDPRDAVLAILPTEAARLITAYRMATSGGRTVAQSTLDTVNDNLAGAYQAFERVLGGLKDGYEAYLGLGTPAMVDVAAEDGRLPVAVFARRIEAEAQTQGILLEEREREILEDTLLTALAQQIHHRVLTARDLVREMDADTRAKPMSSKARIGISWVRSDRLTEQQNAVATQLQRSAAALGPDGLAQLRSRLREMIREHRARNPRDTYRETLAGVLDYRSWYMFAIQIIRPGGKAEQLTRKRHEEMSGGEKSAAIHLPLFAAANALYSSAHPHCPRPIALDEAFAGIDGNFLPDLLGLTTKFDLDLFMTGHELWITYPSVPMIAHYDLRHDEASHTVSSLLILWDGEQLIDAAAGFGGNDDVARELLGFTPTRREPATSTPGGLFTRSAEDLDDEDAEGGEEA
ncbi:MAG TPA: TIGR02680 family protein [Actinocrinis sp.]|nr:TIGR02680 family protein [Actinocrinis sp.]